MGAVKVDTTAIILALLPTSCVTLNMLLNISRTQCSHLQNEGGMIIST